MDFKEFIASSLKKHPELKIAIADEFEIAKGTVERWATGAANPLPRVAKLVVRFVEGQLEEKIDFKEFIASSLKKNPRLKFVIVSHFKVSNFIVECWANGTAVPAHSVQKDVIDLIKNNLGE